MSSDDTVNDPVYPASSCLNEIQRPRVWMGRVTIEAVVKSQFDATNPDDIFLMVTVSTPLVESHRF